MRSPLRNAVQFDYNRLVSIGHRIVSSLHYDFWSTEKQNLFGDSINSVRSTQKVHLPTPTPASYTFVSTVMTLM